VGGKDVLKSQSERKTGAETLKGEKKSLFHPGEGGKLSQDARKRTDCKGSSQSGPSEARDLQGGRRCGEVNFLPWGGHRTSIMGG